MRRCKCSPDAQSGCALRLACTPLQAQRGPNPKPDSLLVADYSTFDTGGYRAQSKTERRQFNSKLSFGAHVFMPYVGGVVPYRQKCDAVAANGYQGFRLSSSAAEPSDPAAPPVDRLRHDA